MLCWRDSDRSELMAECARSSADLCFLHSLPNTHYIETTFTVEDGLSSNIVPTVLQARDGFLWVGTKDGLLRFDGRHFTAVHFPQRASGAVYVSALAEGPDGGLWIGGSEGFAEISQEALKQLDHASSALYQPGLGDSNHIECLHFSPDGILWVGADAGLFRFQHGKFSTIIPGLDDFPY